MTGTAAAVEWPTHAAPELLRGIHRVFRAVAETGGAIGYLVPPTVSDVDDWLTDVLNDVGTGNAALAVAHQQQRIEALGLWRRSAHPLFAHSAEIQKVATHPDARGLGLGRRVVSALVENARTTDLEALDLSVRGNNHGAVALYEDLGFTVWGRRPNAIEVGDHRFDDVRMGLTLGHRPGTILHGSRREGAGSSGWSPIPQA